MGGREARLCPVGAAIITDYNTAIFHADKPAAMDALHRYDEHTDKCKKCLTKEGDEC